MKLFYRKLGAGPPLIILHGLYGSSDNWLSIARRIENRCTVILPDLRNHGHSPHNHVHDYDSMVNDLYELISELDIEKFYLAGHSMGGKVAMRFALTYPESLRGLLIADISPFSSLESGKRELAFHKEVLNLMISSNLSDIKARSEVELMFSGIIKSERIRGFILKNLKRENENRYSWKLNAAALLSNLDKIMDGIVRPDSTEVLTEGFPVVFLKGNESDYLNADNYPSIREIFPNAQFVEVPGAGHWIHADNPEVVINALSGLIYPVF